MTPLSGCSGSTNLARSTTALCLPEVSEMEILKEEEEEAAHDVYSPLPL